MIYSIIALITCYFNFYEKPFLTDINKDNYLESDEEEESDEDYKI